MDTTRELITWFAAIAGLAGVLIAPVTGVMAVLKTLFNGKIPSVYLPACSVAIGVVLADAVLLAAPFVMDFGTTLAAGALAGYTASALYSQTKAQSAKNAVANSVAAAQTADLTSPRPV